MLSSLTTKLALKKVGLPSNALDFTSYTPFDSSPSASTSKSASSPDNNDPSSASTDATAKSWLTTWLSPKNLPLTVQPWLTPPPPACPVAADCPQIGDLAPFDRDRRLAFGGGRRVLVVFLRCVGCAFAQRTFLALRTLANRYPDSLHCIAVSHASTAATRKWMDLLGGAWNVEVVVDPERAVYAAWGLGMASVWALFNPATQVQGWREKGWLGASVAGAMERTGKLDPGAGGGKKASSGKDGGREVETEVGPPETVMGNKWQESGAWAVDGRGKVVWGGKARTADEVVDLDQGVQALGL